MHVPARVPAKTSHCCEQLCPRLEGRCHLVTPELFPEEAPWGWALQPGVGGVESRLRRCGQRHLPGLWASPLPRPAVGLPTPSLPRHQLGALQVNSDPVYLETAQTLHAGRGLRARDCPLPAGDTNLKSRLSPLLASDWL